jgi:hypothetical protein
MGAEEQGAGRRTACWHQADHTAASSTEDLTPRRLVLVTFRRGQNSFCFLMEGILAEATVSKLPTPERIPISLTLGDRIIDGATIRPLSFQAFADIISEAQGMTVPKTFEGRLKRLRMYKQVAYYAGATQVQLTIQDILKLPIPDVRAITAKFDTSTDEGKAGKIIREGNGIDQAIVFELGNPIPTGSGKQPIKELEFLAKTYGDIEDVLAAENSIQQAAQLIATVAKPLGSSLSLLPSWATSAISVADGVTISQVVLPHFLGSADE